MADLIVKKLSEQALLPVCAHPGEDLAYDVFALEDITVQPFSVNKVRTGISAYMSDIFNKLGLVVKDRSSMALSGLFTVGGVIDNGYRGEIIILMRSTGSALIDIRAGQKIAQLMPVVVYTYGKVVEVESMTTSERGVAGFGSTGA